MFQPPGDCPVCGGEVPRGARACPHCGADERSGWDEEAARYDGTDLPPEAFAGESEPRRPRRRHRAPARTGVATWVVIVAIVLVVAITLPALVALFLG